MNKVLFTKQKGTVTINLTKIAILAALSSIAMLFEFPLPFMPPFLKIDFSLVIVLIGGLVIGPFAVIPISLIKALVSLLSSSSEGVGSLADFIISVSFALPFVSIYKKIRGIKGIIISSIVGTVFIAIVGALANIYILLPFYNLVIPLENIWLMCSKINPLIVDLKTYILYGAIPFNILKGFIVSIATYLVYKALLRTNGHL